jgi:hypothetical protein
MAQEDLHQAEMEACKLLTGEFEGHAQYAIDAYNLLGRVVASHGELGVTEPESQLSIRIASRMANDLNCATELAFRGYGPQGCGLVATMFELAFTWIKVLNEGRPSVERWLTHDNLRNTPVRAKEGLEYFVAMAVDRAGAPPKKERRALINGFVEREYKVYTDLCAFKHGNPRAIQAIESADGRAMAPIGPDAGTSGKMSLCFAVEHGGRFAEMATECWLLQRVAETERQPFTEKLERLSATREALAKASRERWQAPIAAETVKPPPLPQNG